MTNITFQEMELVPAGFANGISMQLANKQTTEGSQAQLSCAEKEVIIEQAALHFGRFLIIFFFDL